MTMRLSQLYSVQKRQIFPNVAGHMHVHRAVAVNSDEDEAH